MTSRKRCSLSRSAFSACLRSVISRTTKIILVGFPSVPRTNSPFISVSKVLPSLRSPRYSAGPDRMPFSIRDSARSRSSGAMKSELNRPNNSSSRSKPNILMAERETMMMRPSRSVIVMSSGEALRIARYNASLSRKDSSPRLRSVISVPYTARWVTFPVASLTG